MVPFGGHKGFAIMMATEILGRIFAGADDYVEPDLGTPHMRHQGVVMIVLKADLFQPFDKFSERTQELAESVRAIAPAPGFDEVLVPGDPEKRARAIRSREGIPIHDDIWESIRQLIE